MHLIQLITRLWSTLTGASDIEVPDATAFPWATGNAPALWHHPRQGFNTWLFFGPWGLSITLKTAFPQMLNYWPSSSMAEKSASPKRFFWRILAKCSLTSLCQLSVKTTAPVAARDAGHTLVYCLANPKNHVLFKTLYFATGFVLREQWYVRRNRKVIYNLHLYVCDVWSFKGVP